MLPPAHWAALATPGLIIIRFSGGSVVVKNLPANTEGLGSIPGWGRSPGEGNGNPLQYPYLGNPMDRGAWWATVYQVAKSQTRLSEKVTAEVLTNTHQALSTQQSHSNCLPPIV